MIIDDLKGIINTVLTNRGKATVNSIDKTSDLRNDIGMDSLDLAELTVRVEAQFDVDIFEDGIITTVGQVVDKLK